MIFLATALLSCGWAFGQTSEPAHWELGFTTTDADLSPDDRLVAITLESPSAPQKAGELVVEFLQVWDYQRKSKISSTQLATYPNIKPTPNLVRFTADGSLLVASDPTRLHVLDAATLKSVRLIEPQLAPESRITAAETSPTGHIVVIGTGGEPGNGILFVYDLDSGSQLFHWKSPQPVRSISWKPDGKQIAVAAPFLCTRYRDTVHVFNTNPWLHLKTLTARNPASLTLSQDRLYLVESSGCKGSAFDRHLGLEAFDARSWEQRKTIFLQHIDIHDSVSFENGRVLANTGKVKTRHDWLDGTTWGTNMDTQLTVWDGGATSITYASPRLAAGAHGRDVELRLSRTGNMVLFNPQSPQVFQIP
jgi:WD40 repeat protein